MGILDNAINKALKWETVTVTPEQMASLVETKLIPICSEKELNELKKGMEKTWVLATERGRAIRFYPRVTAIRICLDFNTLTHQLSKLSLMDNPAKREYILPKGGNYAKQAQQLIMNKLLTMNSANINAFVQPVQTQQAAPMQQQAVPVQSQQAASVQPQQAAPVQPHQAAPAQPQQATPMQPQYYSVPNVTAKKPNTGASITSMVLGIVSMLAWIIPLLGFPCSATGLVLGIMSKAKKVGGTATAGIVLSSIGLFFTIINSILGAIIGANIY